MDCSEAIAELKKPLDPKHVRPPKQFGPKGDYIEAWRVQAEANRIFGFDGWTQEVIETSCVAQAERPIGRDKKPGWGVTYTAKVRVTALGVTRDDFGAGHGYDADLGLAHESAIKEAVSDAMKRALKSFGNPFGLALYDKEKANVRDPQAEAASRASVAKTWANKFAAAVINASDWTVAGRLWSEKIENICKVWPYDEAREIIEEAMRGHGITVTIRDGKPALNDATPDPVEAMAAG